MQTEKGWVEWLVSGVLDTVAGPLEFCELSVYERLHMLHTYYQLRALIASGGDGSREDASRIALYIAGALPHNGGTD